MAKQSSALGCHQRPDLVRSGRRAGADTDERVSAITVVGHVRQERERRQSDQGDGRQRQLPRGAAAADVAVVPNEQWQSRPTRLAVGQSRLVRSALCVGVPSTAGKSESSRCSLRCCATPTAMPIIREIQAKRLGVPRRREDRLASGWGAPGKATKRVRATIGLALDFLAWRTRDARRLSRSDAIDVMSVGRQRPRRPRTDRRP
jgi:hypothetical protein